jgi:hypothetical protein
MKNEMRMNMRVEIFKFEYFKCCSVCSIESELKNCLQVEARLNPFTGDFDLPKRICF